MLAQRAWNCITNWNMLSNRVFESYGAIIAASCQAWNKPTARPETIKSIVMH